MHPAILNADTAGQPTLPGDQPVDPSVQSHGHTASAREPLDRAGDELVSKLGEGGFGNVWLAERRQPFVRQVALKIVKLGMDSASVVARFEQERQALAVMNHPNVAKVLDGGLTPQGRPYFAMEFVKGEPITDFCDRQRLPIRRRLSRFTQVCAAVQHAHTKGIIHRDLKPGNILVATGEGGTGVVKVIDFGIAKALTQRMSEHTILTQAGQMIGTPEYMSPEQAEPDANDIRRRIIREEDPPSPSARLSTIDANDGDPATRIAQSRARSRELSRGPAARRGAGVDGLPRSQVRATPSRRGHRDGRRLHRTRARPRDPAVACDRDGARGRTPPRRRTEAGERLPGEDAPSRR
jgi:hypothetical protein